MNKRNKQNNNLYKSNNNIIPSWSIFHKSKKEYYEFNPKPDVEEIPTFTFENDRNLNSYKGRINNKYNQIEQYSKNFHNNEETIIQEFLTGRCLGCFQLGGGHGATEYVQVDRLDQGIHGPR